MDRLALPPVKEHDAEAPPGPGIERGAQAGIEPAAGAWMTQQIGSAKALRNMSTQLHPLMPTSPPPARRPGFATGCAARPKGDAPRVHRCGREMYRSGRTEGDVQNRRPGGLDARLGAGLVTDHR